MEDAEGVRYDVDGPVARVTIDREARRNALSWDVVRGLRAAVAAAGEDAGVRVLVLTGTGERAFCAGADLTGMAAGDEAAEGLAAFAEKRPPTWRSG